MKLLGMFIIMKLIMKLKSGILDIIRKPKEVVSDEHKISSYESDLIGFKLLDGVSKEELIKVASRLREGKHLAYFVGEGGVDYEVETKEDIARTLKKIIF